MTQSLTERYDERIGGVLSCYDRVVITGTLPGLCYADGMTRYFQANGIRTRCVGTGQQYSPSSTSVPPCLFVRWRLRRFE